MCLRSLIGFAACVSRQYDTVFQPGRGNFVVRVSTQSEPIVELLEMKRPFPPLKALDVDDVVAKIKAALNQAA